MLTVLTELVFDLNEKKMYHGDIQPINILIDKDEKIKLLETPLLSHYYSGFERMLVDPNYYTTLSPEYLNLLSNIKKGNKKIPNIDREKSEMFSVGMTCLALAVNDYIT